MKALLVAARDNEPKFIVRLLQVSTSLCPLLLYGILCHPQRAWRRLQGKMRIGLAEQTVLAALAQAAVMQEQPPVSQSELPARLDEAQKAMKEAYHLLPVVDLLVKAILEGAFRHPP